MQHPPEPGRLLTSLALESILRRRSVLDEAVGEWFAIEDEGGRSPSRQVNEAADHLQRWLARHGVHVQVQRWVVLAHERSRVVQTNNLTVDTVLTLSDLNIQALLEQAKVAPLSPIPVDRVRTLASRDHHHFERRRATRSANQARATVPPAQGWPQAGRVERLVELARQAQAQHESNVVQTVRTAIRHDLLVRPQPLEVPALLNAFREDVTTRDIVARIIEETCQVFEERDRCLVVLTIPVAVRLRKFLNGDYVCASVHPKTMASIEGLSRACNGMHRVVFDHRLYTTEAVREIGPQPMRRYAIDLANRGVLAAPPAETTRLVAARDGHWSLVHVLGVAVLDPSEVERARSLTRLPTLGPFVCHPLGAFDGSVLKCTVPGVMHETSSVGVCTLAHGLRVGAEELRRLTMGVQAATPESVFMVPLRLAL